jgi:hypothetical protein
MFPRLQRAKYAACVIDQVISMFKPPIKLERNLTTGKVPTDKISLSMFAASIFK